MRLGVKFAIAFFISSIASIFFISLLSYTLARNALQKTIVTQQQEQTRQTMDSIDRILNQRLSAINAIAQNDSILSFVQNASAALQPDELLLGKVHNTLQTLLTITGAWEDVDVISANGTVLYSDLPQAVGTSVLTQNSSFWFVKAKQGKAVYSDVLKDPQTHDESIIFAAPIIEKATHTVIGVLWGHTSWKEAASAIHFVNSNIVEVYNKNGLLIGDNQQESSGNTPFLTKSPLTSTLLHMGTSEVNKTLTTNDELVSIASENGFGSYKGNGWLLVTRTPVKIAFAPAVNSAIIIAGLLLPVIIVVNASLLIFILELLRPILLIGQVADDIAKGNLTKRVPHIGTDEIGWLAASFNRMADTLQELYDGMEKKIQEKTKELSDKMEDAETMNRFMIGRELKLIELKKQVTELKQQLSEKQT